MGQPGTRCHCKCKPKTLLQWEGDAPWSVTTGFDALPEVKAQLERIRPQKHHQVRVFFDDTNADWMENWYLSGDHLTIPLPTYHRGGALRDGIPYGIGSPGAAHWGNYPWRLELGCIDCRSCSCAPEDGLIWWPKREQVTTTPIWSGVFPNNYVSDVTQTTSTADGDYGRAPTADEISRHHWWGNKAYGQPAESRRCPPEIIVWNHAFGTNTELAYPPEPLDGQQMYGELSTDLDVHRANGFADVYELSSLQSQRFEDVDLSGVNAIRLTNTMFHDMSLTVSGGPPINPPADITDVTTDGYQAITDWLDEGGKTLILDGGSGFGANFPAFVAKFCSIGLSPLTGPEMHLFVHYQLGTYPFPQNQTAKYVARDHSLANYPSESNLPIFSGYDVFYNLWKTSGGEVLYDFVWATPALSESGSFEAIAAETLPSGSRVVVVPQQLVKVRGADAIAKGNWTFQWGVRGLL